MAPRNKKKAPREKTKLESALEFARVAQIDKPTDMLYQSHCRIANGELTAFDGILCVGHPVDEDFHICPHTYRLHDAIKRCKDTLSLTQLDDATLSVKSGRFRANVQCLNLASIPHQMPDPKQGVITDAIRAGFEKLNPIVKGKADTVVYASLLLQNYSMIATNGHVALEYWHGINLPNGLAIPKEAINAVLKIPEKLTGIGVSPRTVTFWFEGDKWLRTQLWDAEWPDVEGRVFANGDHTRAKELPPNFFEAVTAVAPFCGDSETIYIGGTGVSSTVDPENGASYEIEGLPDSLIFNPAYLMVMDKLNAKVDLEGVNNITFFWAENIRGAIMQKVRR
jgi:hypothetical protein